jgi:group I intron endonuclease
MELDVTGIIYLWTNKITNKHYVGQTINPEQRKAAHLCEAFTRGSDYYFHRSLRKHGLDAFTYEVLEENIERDRLNERENHYIAKYNSIWPNGYNQCEANSLAESSIEKMRKTKKRQWQELDEESKKQKLEQLRQSNIGRKKSDSQKKKVAEALQHKWLITYPDGTQKTIVNLRQFCKDEGLGTNGQSNLTRGAYRGYKAEKLQ